VGCGSRTRDHSDCTVSGIRSLPANKSYRGGRQRDRTSSSVDEQSNRSIELQRFQLGPADGYEEGFTISGSLILGE